MLVLTRFVGEVVRVGEDVSITVLSVKGKQIRLGINAPKEVPVHRAEVYQQIAADGIAVNEKDKPQRQDLGDTTIT